MFTAPARRECYDMEAHLESLSTTIATSSPTSQSQIAHSLVHIFFSSLPDELFFLPALRALVTGASFPAWRTQLADAAAVHVEAEPGAADALLARLSTAAVADDDAANYGAAANTAGSRAVWPAGSIAPSARALGVVTRASVGDAAQPSAGSLSSRPRAVLGASDGPPPEWLFSRPATAAVVAAGTAATSRLLRGVTAWIIRACASRCGDGSTRQIFDVALKRRLMLESAPAALSVLLELAAALGPPNSFSTETALETLLQLVSRGDGVVGAPPLSLFWPRLAELFLRISRSGESSTLKIVRHLAASANAALAESSERAAVILGALGSIIADGVRRGESGAVADTDCNTDCSGSAAEILRVAAPTLARASGSPNAHVASSALAVFRDVAVARAAARAGVATLVTLVMGITRNGACELHWSAAIDRAVAEALDALQNAAGDAVWTSMLNALVFPVTTGGGANSAAAVGGRDPLPIVKSISGPAVYHATRAPCVAVAATGATALPTSVRAQRIPGSVTADASTQLRLFREALAPAASAAAASAATATTTSDAALASTLGAEPLLLPQLNFHDLVFGRELGSGAFAVVRFARVIFRGAPASTWPDVAIKVLPVATVSTLKYARAAAREVATLSLLKHANIVRLLNAFRWRGAALLVLELGGGGDLHGALVRGGPLEEGAACLLAAEVAAALRAVHAAGFAFGDVKPENIVLVDAKARGVHAKLTDFAAARAVTDAGRAALKGADVMLSGLPDGDWRTNGDLNKLEGTTHVASPPASPQAASTAENQVPSPHAHFEELRDREGREDGEEDERLEGTAEYLPPEARGGHVGPSIAGDAWAFGLVIFQMLTGGALPVLRNRAEDGVARKSVRFARDNDDSDESPFPPGFPAAAADLCTRLWCEDPSERLGMTGFDEILSHSLFSLLGGVDDDKLAGAIVPSIKAVRDVQSDPLGLRAADAAKWLRRHQSSLWAPRANEPADAGAPAPVGVERAWSLRQLIDATALPVL